MIQEKYCRGAMRGEKSKSNIVVDEDTTLTSRMKDYTGTIVDGKWEILRPAGKNYKNRMIWVFKCLNCGKEYIRIPANIPLCSCDCLHNPSRMKFSKSFFDWCIENNKREWLDLWDYDLNDRTPKEVGFGSDMKFYFKCENHIKEHHSEKYSLSTLTGRQIIGLRCSQCNSFAQSGINLVGDKFLDIYWDYEKNKNIDPWKISRGSGIKVYIKCPKGKHNSHLVTAKDADKFEYSCPECSSELKNSKLYYKTIDYINELGYTCLTEHACSLRPKSPMTGHYMPYDIEVPELKLIIEVMGEQHYSFKSLFIKMSAAKNGVSDVQAFNRRILYDELKRRHAIDNGYTYLELPYNLENNDRYKETIASTVSNIVKAQNSIKN